MDRATFVTLAVPGDVALQALLLAKSLRDFGGSVASEPIWAMVPDGGPRMKRSVAAEFEDLGVRLVPFAVDAEVVRIPFATKAMAGAVAEKALGTDLMIWMDPDTVIVSGAGELVIPEGVSLGYRPVHHRLIGLEADSEIGGIWRPVLDACQVSEDRLFRMYTNVGERIKAYMSAGLYVIRPELGLLQRWHDALVSLSRAPQITSYTRHDDLCSTFLHQVVWTGVLLATLERSEMMELSPAINYPLALHDQIPAGRRPLSLHRLTAVRTEDLLLDPEWKENIPLMGSLAPWLETQPLLTMR